MILPPLDFRIPKWDFDELQVRPCPICNNANSIIKHIRPDLLTVNLCDTCTTFFISPAPSSHQLSDFYSIYDESHRREPNISAAELFLAYQDIDPLTDFRIQILNNHISLPNSKVLDVGFGRARFLYALLKLGAIPFGVELDEKAIEYAKALGINRVNKSSLEDLNNETKFDLIILNDLIEHPLNPMSLLKKASDLLENNGLLMIWTPNGEITNSEDCPTTFRVDLEHMQYLTPTSCNYIATEINLKIVHLETMGFPNLNGINNNPLKKVLNLNLQVKKVIRIIPGMSLLFRILKTIKRNLDFSTREEKKLGSYHLFCIMQKKISDKKH